MPWNGSGNFNRTDGARFGTTVWAQARDAGVNVNAVPHDIHDEDLADGIEKCLAKDGQNSPTAHIDWGGFNLTSVGMLNADTINETTTDGGVTIDGLLIKDGNIGGVAPDFPSGTVCIFYQNTAPTNWTKDEANHDNHALRITTGTGGTTGGSQPFTTAFASQTPSGTVTIASENLNLSVSSANVTGLNTGTAAPNPASHQHNVDYETSSGGGGAPQWQSLGGGAGGSQNTDAAGSGSTHTHSVTGSGSHSHMMGGTTGSHGHSGSTFSGNAIDLAVQYVNVIKASKNS